MNAIFENVRRELADQLGIDLTHEVHAESVIDAILEVHARTRTPIPEYILNLQRQRKDRR